MEGISQSTFLQSAASCQKFTILSKQKYFLKFVCLFMLVGYKSELNNCKGSKIVLIVFVNGLEKV